MQLRRGQFWSTFWVLALLLAWLVNWFLSNLLHTLFWKLLGDWRIPLTEGQMTTYIAANLIPFMCVLLAAAILAILIRNHMAFVDNATGAADPIAQAEKGGRR